jgi:hypothetical protein
MIAKVAEALALRKAFPYDPENRQGISADVYTADEMAQAERPVEAPRPSTRERITAKAAEVKVIDLPAAEPIPDEVREVYVNADELAGGAPAVLRSEVTAGLSVESFKDLCVKAAKSSVAIAKVIECTVDQVGPRVKAMTPVERGVLADELNIDWRAS